MALLRFFSVTIIIWAFVVALFSFFSVAINNFVVDHLHLFLAWFSFFSVTIKNFVLDHLHLVVMSLFSFLSGPINNFLLNHLYPVVMALLPFFFTYFSFQIKNFLWDYLKPLLQIFVRTLLLKTKLKAPTTAATLPSVQLMSTTPIEFGREMFESRIQEALNFLRDDSQQGVLGIWGMGGVGKTTLLEHINNELAKKSSSLFGLDKVVFVTASRESTPEKIQTELAKKLGMTQGVDQAGIFNYLSNKSFAILLDDVWERQDLNVVGVQLPVDLKKVGVPLPLGVVGEQKLKRKLILTTRSQHVCIKMDARQTINVECLSIEDARRLFRYNARVDATVIRDNPLIEELADKVADECGGLPIALITTGQALAGGDQTVQVWEHALQSLKKSKFLQIPGMDDPLPLLKVSYDHLKDPREKECLLHCALWPEDYTILKDDLIQCWMGHGLLGKFDSIQEACNNGHAIIHSLLKVCLLENVKVLDEFTLKNEEVKLHDVIRDMALWIARDCGANENNWKVLAGQDLSEAPQDEESWREAHKISLMYNKIKSLPSNIQSTPNLTTLMLRANRFHDGGLRMSKYFNSLKYLDISGCFSLECLPTEICGLTKLEYLNISSTRIRSLPEELKALVNMKYLIARRTSYIDHRVPPELLSNLVNLIELDLFGSGNTQDFVSSVIDNLDCLEGRLKGLGITVTTVSNLQKLVQLSGGIPISSLYLDGMEGLYSSLELLSRDFLGSYCHIGSNLKELTLSRCESVEEVVVECRHQLNIERLDLFWAKGLKEIKWKGVKPRDVLRKLRQLTVIGSYALKSIEWVMYLPCLEILKVGHCREMEQMLGKEGGAAGTKQEEEDRPTFPSLRILTLNYMSKLSSICHRPLTFPSLEFLHINKCEQLKKLPFNSPSSCTKLRAIHCDYATWEGLDLEDDMQATLKPFLKTAE